MNVILLKTGTCKKQLPLLENGRTACLLFLNLSAISEKLSCGGTQVALGNNYKSEIIWATPQEKYEPFPILLVIKGRFFNLFKYI